MKKLTFVLCVGLLSSGLVFAAANTGAGIVAAYQGETFTHSEAGVKFQLPQGWTAKPDGELLTVSSADGALQMVFWVPDESTFEAAVKELDKELAKTIKNIKTVGKPTNDTHNGMAHYSEEGTGVVSGATIAWSVDVLAAKKPLIILTFAAPDLMAKHADNYMKLAGSIKKVE